VPASAGLDQPVGLAFDPAGNLIVADTSQVEKVSPTGTLSTLVPVIDATAVAINVAGDSFIGADFGYTQVKEISPQGTVTAFGPSDSSSGVGGLTLDAAGDVYVTLRNTGNIDKLTPTGAVSLFSSGFSGPRGIAIGPSGDRYVASYSDGTVKKVSPDGTTITGFLTGLNGPSGLAFDRQGDIYVAEDSGSFMGTAEFDPSGTPVNTFSSPDYPHNLAIVQSPAPQSISVTGASTTGHALTCSASWAPDVAGSFDFGQPTATSYAWMRSGTPIAGATSATYTPITAGTYACSATGANQAGPTTETSAAVTVTHPAPPPPPSNALAVKSKKFDGRDRIQLRLQTKAAGRLSAKVTYRTTKTTYSGRGHHRRRHVRHITNTVGTKTAAIHGAGITSVTISSRHGFAKTLAKLKTIRLSIALRFTPTGGKLRTVTPSLTIHAPKPRHKPKRHH
jgi:hypothetical protein